MTASVSSEPRRRGGLTRFECAAAATSVSSQVLVLRVTPGTGHRPELIRGVLVPGIGPYLGGLAVRYVKNLHGVVLQAPALALGADCGQRDRVLVIGDHVVHLDGDGPPACLECAQKPSRHLIDALIVAAERTPGRIMPSDVLSEEPALQRVDITMPKGRISVPQQILIGVCHPDPPFQPAPAGTGTVSSFHSRAAAATVADVMRRCRLGRGPADHQAPSRRVP